MGTAGQWKGEAEKIVIAYAAEILRVHGADLQPCSLFQSSQTGRIPGGSINILLACVNGATHAMGAGADADGEKFVAVFLC